jgi:hypothetical protein
MAASDTFDSALRTVSEAMPYEQRLAASISYVLDEGGKLFMGQSEVNKSLVRITKQLEELGVPYAVAGGMAMIAHGYMRFTDDVDILVNREGLERLHEALDGRGWIRPFSKSKNLRDASTGVKIEFLLTGDYPGDGKPKPVAFPLPENVASEIQGIKYLNVPTLINLKLASYMTGADRAKDLGDVQELMKAKGLSFELADSVDPYVRALYLDLCQRLATTARPFVKFWEGALPSSLPTAGPKLQVALSAIDPTLAPLFADGIIAELVKGKRETHVKLTTHDRRLAQKYEMVDESETLLE